MKAVKRECPQCHEIKEFRLDCKTCGCLRPKKIIEAIPDARIGFLDIETMPSLGYTWGKWEQNVLDFYQEGYLASYGFKIAGGRGVKMRALPDYPNWETDKRDDSALASELWEDLNSVDIVVAQNGDAFDLPTIRTRWLVLGLLPVRPVQTVDTLKVARSVFKFKSNKLDDMCRELGIGRKVSHTGFDLWRSCMNGDIKAWHTMVRYNRHDVLLLEELYYRFLPWMLQHPNVIHDGNPDRCRRCGSENVRHDGYKYTDFRKKDRIHCLNCTAWFEGSAKKV
ncbi:MAG: ribonuclease H-like domain-containing protein [Thaumarchaeota archaeon]|nr:ribonuclease H-like domain-containing protein [Nitrososphaerota archaeon]